MDEIIDRIPQLENRVYILGGPRDLALKEAMALILGITDRHYLSTEFYCMKSTEEEIRTEFEETAASKGLGKGARSFFRTQRNGDVEVVVKKIWASYDRRFVRLVFIDSLEALHFKGEAHDRKKVLARLRTACPIIVVSDELAQSGSDGGQLECEGRKNSLTVR